MIECTNIPASTFSMTSYTGQWTSLEAAHLLRRTTFGPTQQQIDDIVAMGMDAAVEAIVQMTAFPDPVVFHPDENIATFGASWHNEFLPDDETLRDETKSARKWSMQAWIGRRINNEQLASPTITEKMCQFWHNHFAVNKTGDDRITYSYFKTLEANALGNFKTMVEQITIDPCMMLFLDTAWNTKWAPNENYARELLELYTVGKGEHLGGGDYSNYTEEDILEGAKILTGWKVRENNSSTAHPYSEFDTDHHEQSDKHLSHHFNNAVLSNNEDQEYLDFINLIFQNDQCAYHLVTKFYRYFVSTEVTQDIENQVIEHLAQLFIANNYDIRPVIVELLKSEHFYDNVNIGANIKSPLEFLFSVVNPMMAMPAIGTEGDHVIWRQFYQKASGWDQSWLYPPSVAGWPAYYQQPAYNQHWLNASTIDSRFWFITQMTTHNTGISTDPFGTEHIFKPDSLAFLDQLDTPSDGIAVIDQLAGLFFSRPLDQSRKDMLLNTLTDGLPAFEWTIQYGEYIANQSDPTFSDPVKDVFEKTLSQLFMLPEFQCC